MRILTDYFVHARVKGFVEGARNFTIHALHVTSFRQLSLHHQRRGEGKTLLSQGLSFVCPRLARTNPLLKIRTKAASPFLSLSVFHVGAKWMM